jgi:hypothetical protein
MNMKRFGMIFGLLVALLAPQHLAAQAPDVYEEISKEMVKLLSAESEDWEPGMKKLRERNPGAYDAALDSIYRSRREIESDPKIERRRYLGLNDPVLKHAILYGLRSDPEPRGLDSCMGNLVSIDSDKIPNADAIGFLRHALRDESDPQNRTKIITLLTSLGVDTKEITARYEKEQEAERLFRKNYSEAKTPEERARILKEYQRKRLEMSAANPAE